MTSSASFNFRDNLTVDNNKYLKWLDSTNTTKNNILALDTNGNLILNSAQRDIYINSNNSGSNTYFNINNSKNVLINSNLAVGINNTSNLYANISLPLNSFIGLNSTQGSHSGYLGLAGSSSLFNTTGSRIILYGIDATGGNNGSLNLYSGNNTASNIQFYSGTVGNDSMKFQILNSGTVNFQPDGSTIVLSVTSTATTVTTPFVITDTSPSINSNSGALQVNGGVGVEGDVFVNGTLSINSLVGNLSFNNTTPSLSYSSGSFYLGGGIGLECSLDAVSVTSGGAISAAGGLALGKNAIIGGHIQILNSDPSISAITGSGVFYGGLGINDKLNIRSDSVSQIQITPFTNNNSTYITFNNQNNYTTTGSWIIGQNNSNFIITSLNHDNYITFNNNNTILINKYTNLLNTLNFSNNTINDFIILNDTNGNYNWSIGEINNENGNFQISRFTSGNFINYILTSDNLTGNITIYGTENSLSSISGGSLTINGGASITKDLYIGGNITVSGGGNINFSGNLVSQSSSDTNTFSYLTLTATDQSINQSTGSLITFGGISIQSNLDTISPTNGGSFLVMGGASIFKSLIVGNTVTSIMVSSNYAMLTNTTISNIYNSNINSTNITNTNLINTTSSINNLINTSQTTLNSIITNSTITNLVSSIISISNASFINITSASADILNITSTNTLLTNINSTNTTITNIISINTTIANIISNAITTSNIIINNTLNAKFNSNTLGNLYTTNGNVGINITAPKATLDVSGNARISTFITTGNIYSTNITSTNIVSTNNSMQNSIITNITNNSIVITNGSLNATFNSNTIGNLYTTNGNVNIGSVIQSGTLSIYTTSPSGNPALTSTGSLFLGYGSGSPGSQVNFDLSTYNTGNLPTTRINLTDDGNFSSSFNILTKIPGAVGNTLGSRIFIQSSMGNIGINTTTPNYQLDVNGTCRIGISLTTCNIYSKNITSSNIVSTNITISNGLTSIYNNNTLGNLYTTGGNVGINNTSPNQMIELSPIAYNNNLTGGIRIGTNNYINTIDESYRYIDLRLTSDGMSNFRGSIYGTLTGGTPTEYEYISFNQAGTISAYAPIIMYDNTISSDSNTGTLVIPNGSIAIGSNNNATGIAEGGALTVAGGGAFSQNVYIGGDLTVTGSILYANAAAASSTFAYLTLTATDQSINLSTGSLITYGGITIQANANATNFTAGGGLTVAGGVGIGLDLYVGGTLNVNSGSNLQNITVSNITINNQIKCLYNSTNTLGNLYTTGGNVGINNVNPSFNLDVNGSSRILSIQTSQNSTGWNSSLWIRPNSIGGENYQMFNNFGRTNIGTWLIGTPSGVTGGTFQIGYAGQSNYTLNITTSGNIGINTTNPSYTLDIVGNVSLRTTSSSSNSSTGTFISAGGISIYNSTNATSTTSGGGLTIAGGVAIAKDVYVGGTVTSSSDKRLKKNIQLINDSLLDKIKNIKSIKYQFKQENNNEKVHYGFIAQDFEKDFSELLYNDNSNAYYSLAYDRITVINLKCIQELLEENIQMKKRIDLIEEILRDIID